MFQKLKRSLGYAALTTLIYFIAANIGYYFFNYRSMFADIYYYDWVEYAIVAGIIFVCSVIVELFRNSTATEDQHSEPQ